VLTGGSDGASAQGGPEKPQLIPVKGTD
jgi:hypothetical protein